MNASSPTTLPLAEAAFPYARHQLTDVERNVVDDIFILARERSLKVQAARRALRDLAFELTVDREGEAVVDSDEFGDYLFEVMHVCAAVAPAALALVPILAPLDRSDGARIELLGQGREKDLERFLRPIFEQAGIADDFTAHRDPPWPDSIADNETE